MRKIIKKYLKKYFPTCVYEWLLYINKKRPHFWQSKIAIDYMLKSKIEHDFFQSHGYNLDWDNLRTFNEKIQWLKLYYRDPLMPRCADKYEARKLVKDIVGETCLVQLYGKWNDPDDIDFSKLPKSFVLKSNHSCGHVIIVNDKDEIDRESVIKIMHSWLRENYYYKFGEWYYKNIKPCIICEELLGDNVNDYKVFCFSGKPAYIQVDFDRSIEEHTQCYYDLSWNNMHFSSAGPLAEKSCPKPKCLDVMLYYAACLSKRFPFARMDFYIVNNKVYFGEFTFFANGGYARFNPEKWDFILGELFDLSCVDEEYVVKKRND